MKQDAKDIKAVINLKMEPSAYKFYYSLRGDLEADGDSKEWNEVVIQVSTKILEFCINKNLRLLDIAVEVNDRFSYMLAWTVYLFFAAFDFDRFDLRRIES